MLLAAAALPSPTTPSNPDIPPFRLPRVPENDASTFPSPLYSSTRRSLLLLTTTGITLVKVSAAPSIASASGLFRMPPPSLSNRYFLVRAGESVFESAGIINTYPVAKTSVDNGLSEAGKAQAVRAALELKRRGACDGSCWIWPSITQRAYQAAEIIAAINGIDRSKIVPEYSFLDARGLGAYEGRSLDSRHLRTRATCCLVTLASLSELLPAGVRTTSHRTLNRQRPTMAPLTRACRCVCSGYAADVSCGTQYFGDTVVSPDCRQDYWVWIFEGDVLLQKCAILGNKFKNMPFRHGDLFFSPGEVRYMNSESIAAYKKPPSGVFKCANPPSCR